MRNEMNLVDANVYYIASQTPVIRLKSSSWVFIGHLSQDRKIVSKIEVYRIEDGIEMFQGYAQPTTSTFRRLTGPMVEAAGQIRRAEQAN